MGKISAALLAVAFLAGCAMEAEQAKTEPDPRLAEIAKEQQKLAMRMDELAKLLIDIKAQGGRAEASAQASRAEPVAAEAKSAAPPVVVEEVAPPRLEVTKIEPPKAEIAKVEPPKAEIAKVEPPKAEVVKVEPAKAEVAKVEPPKAEVVKVEPAKAEAVPMRVEVIPPGADKPGPEGSAPAKEEMPLAQEPGKLTARPLPMEAEVLVPRGAAPGTEAPKTQTVVAAREAEAEQTARLVAMPERSSLPDEPKGEDAAAKLYRRALAAYREGEFGRAILDFEEFTIRHSGHEIADAAQFLVGDSYFQSGQFEQAIVEYNRVAERYPGGRQAPDALYMVGECFDRLGQAERAKVFYLKLLEQYPASDAASRAQRKMGNP